jgi:hypothetical protein
MTFKTEIDEIVRRDNGNPIAVVRQTVTGVEGIHAGVGEVFTASGRERVTIFCRHGEWSCGFVVSTPESYGAGERFERIDPPQRRLEAPAALP